jgi:hypothetical protein
MIEFDKRTDNLLSSLETEELNELNRLLDKVRS